MTEEMEMATMQCPDPPLFESEPEFDESDIDIRINSLMNKSDDSHKEAASTLTADLVKSEQSIPKKNVETIEGDSDIQLNQGVDSERGIPDATTDTRESAAIVEDQNDVSETALQIDSNTELENEAVETNLCLENAECISSVGSNYGVTIPTIVITEYIDPGNQISEVETEMVESDRHFFEDMIDPDCAVFEVSPGTDAESSNDAFQIESISDIGNEESIRGIVCIAEESDSATTNGCVDADASHEDDSKSLIQKETMIDHSTSYGDVDNLNEDMVKTDDGSKDFNTVESIRDIQNEKDKESIPKGACGNIDIKTDGSDILETTVDIINNIVEEGSVENDLDVPEIAAKSENEQSGPYDIKNNVPVLETSIENALPSIPIDAVRSCHDVGTARVSDLDSEIRNSSLEFVIRTEAVESDDLLLNEYEVIEWSTEITDHASLEYNDSSVRKKIPEIENVTDPSLEISSSEDIIVAETDIPVKENEPSLDVVTGAINCSIIDILNPADIPVAYEAVEIDEETVVYECVDATSVSSVSSRGLEMIPDNGPIRYRPNWQNRIATMLCCGSRSRNVKSSGDDLYRESKYSPHLEDVTDTDSYNSENLPSSSGVRQT